MVLARLAVDDYLVAARQRQLAGAWLIASDPASVTGGVRAIVMGDKSDTPSTLR